MHAVKSVATPITRADGRRAAVVQGHAASAGAGEACLGIGNLVVAAMRREGLDEAQMAKWVKQAAALPGWITNKS